MQINDLCQIELLEIKQFDYLTLCVNKCLMFNWIVRDKLQYVEPFNLIDLC